MYKMYFFQKSSPHSFEDHLKILSFTVSRFLKKILAIKNTYDGEKVERDCE